MGDLPSTIGAYSIVRQLGEGGMGAVFEAVHQAIGRRVAIKVLHPEYARNAEFTSRFFNEARAVNLVEHPGLVQISDYGQIADGTAYIVMEYLKGDSLAKRILRTNGPFPVGEVLQIGWQLADSLAAAHDKGIVHRDLKPENVMMVPDPHMPIGERTKLLDFGIAKLTGTSGGPVVKTRTNAVMGSPLYMSPEQCAGAGKVDARSDVYSLGCMLYEMLSGHPPFMAEGGGQVMGMHMFRAPEPLRKLVPSVPAPITTLVDRLLSKEREKRPAMRQLATELEDLFRLAPPPKRRAPATEPTESDDGTRLMAARSTLGQAASQTALRRRRHLGLALATSLGLAGLTITTVIAIHSSRRSATLAAEQSAKLDTQKKQITVRVESVPAGAEVVRVYDGQLLGKTPWQHQQAADASQMIIKLRLAGFTDRNLSLDLGADASRVETLAALPSTITSDKVRAQTDGKPAVSATRSATGKPIKQIKSQTASGLQKIKTAGTSSSSQPTAAPAIYEHPNVEE